MGATDRQVTALREALMLELPPDKAGALTYTAVARALEQPGVMSALCGDDDDGSAPAESAAEGGL